MPWNQPPPANHSRGERWGSALAHGSGLVVGIPLVVTGFLPLSIAMMPCPVVAYFIGRSFRRRGLAWGSFQGLQAAAVHFIIVVLAYASSMGDPWSKLMVTSWIAAVLLFLYTMWGAWDTLFGYDFRYIGISRLLTRVSEANIRRHQRRQRWLDQGSSHPPQSGPEA